MIKRIIILLMLLVTEASLNGATFTVKNETNETINVFASGPSWESGDYKIAPGDQAFIRAPGLIWFAHIKDAANLAKAPSPIEMHFGLNEQAKDKIVKVKRVDTTKANQLVEAQYNSNKVPATTVKWRVFAVNCNQWFQTAQNKGDYDYDHTGYIPADI